MGLFDGTALERPILCERCDLDIKQCQCPPQNTSVDEPEVALSRQQLRVTVEKRKRGKIVTVVSGFTGSDAQRKQLLKELKDLCGAGGTIDAGQLELQGDHTLRIKSVVDRSADQKS